MSFRVRALLTIGTAFVVSLAILFGVVAEFRLNDFVAEQVEMLRRVLPESIALPTEFDPAVGSVRIDPTHFTQVLLNLAFNARDAMPGGGTLMLMTRDLSAGASNAGRLVRLSITDTGCGMDDEVRRHLFEPFFTTKEVGQGTGLGLPAVQGIVTQAGGAIAVETCPGAGTTFHIDLPQVEPAAAPATGAMPVARPALILLVEDEEAVRCVAREALLERGLRVLEAGGGEVALALARERLGSIDAVVTDVVMPGMSGVALVEALWRDQPGLPVVWISGHTGDVGLKDPLPPGTAFLAKPFAPDDLARTVCGLFQRAPSGAVSHS